MKGAIQPADESEMKTENGSREEKSSGSGPKAKPSVRTYRELQRQLHKDLLVQHPEWIDAELTINFIRVLLVFSSCLFARRNFALGLEN